MRPKLRKVNTKKRKQDRKDAKKRLEKQAAAFLNHPKKCCVCNEKFERNHQTVKSWQVTTIEDRVRLTCPNCWGKINKALENEE